MTMEEVVANSETATDSSYVWDDLKVRTHGEDAEARNIFNIGRRLKDFHKRHPHLCANWDTFSKGTSPQTISNSVDSDFKTPSRTLFAGDVRCRSP